MDIDHMTKHDTPFLDWWKVLVDECTRIGIADPGFMASHGYYQMGHTPAAAAIEEAEYLRFVDAYDKTMPVYMS